MRISDYTCNVQTCEDGRRMLSDMLRSRPEVFSLQPPQLVRAEHVLHFVYLCADGCLLFHQCLSLEGPIRRAANLRFANIGSRVLAPRVSAPRVDILGWTSGLQT